MNSTWLRGVRGTLVAALLATFAAGILFPVYTDEVGWRFQERAAIDGVDKLYSEVCGMNTLARPPFFMWPVRDFSAIFNLAFDDPLYVRISGILYAAAWLALLLVLLHRLTAQERPRLVVSIIAVSLMSTATLPFLLLMSRPEQPLNLVTLAILLTSSAAWRRGEEPDVEVAATTPALAWRRSAIIVILAIVGMSYHLKSLFLLPLILACLFFCARGKGTLAPRLAAMAGVCVLFALSTKYWIERLTCNGDAQLHKLYALNNLSAGIGSMKSFDQFADLALAMLNNIRIMPYMMLIAPRPEPNSQWLEWHRISPGASSLWYFAIFVAFSAACIAGLTAFLLAAHRGWKERRFDPMLVCAVAMAAAALGWASTQVSRNPYEAAFVFPLLMLAIVLSLAAYWQNPGKPVLPFAVLGNALALGALASLALTWATYGPGLMKASQERGYLALQPHSISAFGYAAMEPEILATAKLCRIPPPDKARAVMIDDYTYFAYARSHLPQHQLGVLSGWAGSVQDDPLAYLKRRQSDGVIVQCSVLPDDLRAIATAHGQFCCIGKDDF